MKLINDLQDYNGLFSGLKFNTISRIGDQGGNFTQVNGFHIHIFKLKSGLGIELRPSNV
jgi:hypothetical protein